MANKDKNFSTNNKVVAVVFNTPTKDKYSYSLTDDLFSHAYLQLARRIESSGLYFAFVHRAVDYSGRGHFKKHSILKSGLNRLLPLEDKGEINVDVVYDKGRFDYDDILVLNPSSISDICSDKSKAYSLFNKFHSKSSIVHNSQELGQLIENYKNETVVLKDLEGLGGHGVTIAEASKIKLDNYSDFPYILQKFIDTSQGIPGLVSGVHDLRVVILDGKPIYSMIRKAREGEFRANVGYGATIIKVSLKNIPSDVLKICGEIDQEFKGIDRLYSIDFGLDKSGKWFVFELNSRTGIYSSHHKGDEEEYYVNRVADKLIEMARRRR